MHHKADLSVLLHAQSMHKSHFWGMSVLAVQPSSFNLFPKSHDSFSHPLSALSIATFGKTSSIADGSKPLAQAEISIDGEDCCSLINGK